MSPFGSTVPYLLIFPGTSCVALAWTSGLVRDNVARHLSTAVSTDSNDALLGRYVRSQRPRVLPHTQSGVAPSLVAPVRDRAMRSGGMVRLSDRLGGADQDRRQCRSAMTVHRWISVPVVEERFA